MRKFGLLCLSVIFSLGLAAVCGASEGFDDIAKLAKSGVGEGVLVAYVQSSSIAYDLSVDEILYLNDLGVSAQTITAVVDHGRDIRAGKAPIAAAPGDVENSLPPLDAPQAAAAQNDLWSTEQPYTPDPVVNNGDPTVMATPLYEQPELVQETDIVRAPVYQPAVVTAPAPGECTVSTFYEALTPYGTWVKLNDSWCWQPSVGVSDVSWRPYMQRGHWVLTDAGWCWESDYNWGWAPFHYGRWAHVAGYGWMWTPDTTWGPAWVSFRESNSYYGWAPLPPAARFDVGVGLHFGGHHHGGVDVNFGLGYRDYCFIPQERFCDSGLAVYSVRPEQQVAIYNQTTIIQNNVTYVDNRVINNGPRRDRVEAVTHRKLQELRLADASITPGQALTNTSRIDRNRGELQMYRPQVSAVAAFTPAAIAARQEAVQQRRDSQIQKRSEAELTASAKADELRERHLAAVDARKDVAQTRQQALFEQTTEKRSEAQQAALNRQMNAEQNAQKRAELAANLKAEQQRSEDARRQRALLEQHGAEQKKVADELARERDRAARQVATQDSARIAAENKARLVADRQAREQAQKDSSLAAEKAAAQRRAQLAAQNNGAAANAESETRLKQEAARAAREAQMKAQADAMARQKAQLEAERQARAAQRSQPVQPVQPVQPNQPVTGNNDAATHAQQLAQERAAAQAKAQQEAQLKASERAQAEAARAAQLEANKGANQQRAQQLAAEAQARAAQEKAAHDANLAKAQQEAQLKANERAQAEAARAAQLEAGKAANQQAAAQKAAQAQAEAQARAAQAEAARAARQQAAQQAAAQAAANREIKKGIVPPVNPRTGQPYTPEEINAIKAGK